MERKKITFDSFIRGSIGCVLVVGILMLVERLSGVLLPFFIAWLIAYMVYPLVKFFQYKLRLKSRIVSIFCALFLITLVGVYTCSHQRYGAQSVGPACGVAQYPVQHSRLLYHIIICNLYIAGL